MPSCSFLFLKFRCCMLSHMNEVDPFIFRCMFLYEIQNCIFHVFSQHPSHLPWTVYAYGRDGFARECIVPCNLNVMGYSFPPNTRVVSSSFIFFSSLSLSLSLSLLGSLTLLSFNCSLPSKSMRSW